MKILSYLQHQLTNFRHFLFYKKFGKLVWIKSIKAYVLFCRDCGEYICYDGICSNPICPEKICNGG